MLIACTRVCFCFSVCRLWTFKSEIGFTLRFSLKNIKAHRNEAQLHFYLQLPQRNKVQ